MAGYSASERLEISQGGFFTEAELKAKPWLRDLFVLPNPAATDPNSRPASKEARDMYASGGVCAYCLEPGDDRSALIKTARNDHMHPECDEAWTAELAARKAGAR